MKTLTPFEKAEVDKWDSEENRPDDDHYADWLLRTMCNNWVHIYIVLLAQNQVAGLPHDAAHRKALDTSIQLLQSNLDRCQIKLSSMKES